MQLGGKVSTEWTKNLQALLKIFAYSLHFNYLGWQQRREPLSFVTCLLRSKGVLEVEQANFVFSGDSQRLSYGRYAFSCMTTVVIKCFEVP